MSLQASCVVPIAFAMIFSVLPLQGKVDLFMEQP
jgi:hypothetical protein